jgi:hypothetical protein
VPLLEDGLVLAAMPGTPQWWLHRLAAHPDYVAALVVAAGPDWRSRCWQWSDP